MIDIRDYGAVGDGVEDDAEAVRVFQRAVGDAQRLGEALYLPLGYSVKLPPSPLRVRASYRACRWVRSVRRMLGRWLTAAADRMNGSL